MIGIHEVLIRMCWSEMLAVIIGFPVMGYVLLRYKLWREFFSLGCAAISSVVIVMFLSLDDPNLPVMTVFGVAFVVSFLGFYLFFPPIHFLICVILWGYGGGNPFLYIGMIFVLLSYFWSPMPNRHWHLVIRMMTGRRNTMASRGFTLIEMLIVCAMLSILTPVVATTLVSMARMQALAADRSIAVVVCNNALEDLLANHDGVWKPGSVLFGEGLLSAQSQLGEATGMYFVEAGPAPNTWLVTAQLSWSRFRQSHSSQLQTVVYHQEEP